jgi:uncharacterized protein YndB with AHSA1/START domain
MENKNSGTHDRELIITRMLNAPVELVWEVWTKPEHNAQWWGPDGFTNTIAKMDVTPGGEWDLVMHGPDGTDYENKSIFRVVEPLEKIVYEHISYPHFISIITFEAQGEQTFITWHMLFDSVEEFIKIVKTYWAGEGLKQNIEKLSRYVVDQKLG